MLKKNEIEEMGYVDFMSLMNETNRPPGGKDSVRRLVLNTFLKSDSKVLDVGCNTGYCTFEISHLAHCDVTGLDVSSSMIGTAKKNLAEESAFYKEKMRFLEGDAQKLAFADESFDLVMSGGSTAFVDDKPSALAEYKRVCKTWGFVSDICFFYRTTPPQEIIDQMNALMGIEIEVWDKNYWLDLHAAAGLEPYYADTGAMHYATQAEVEQYVRVMIQQIDLEPDAVETAYKKLFDIMNLFNENHRYLDYGVFISRKRPSPEQIALFGY